MPLINKAVNSYKRIPYKEGVLGNRASGMGFSETQGYKKPGL
jgi:hypothetical protein